MRKLIAVQILKASDDMYTLRTEIGQYRFQGTSAELAKLLKDIKATDFVSTPKSSRAKTYQQMVNDVLSGKDRGVWVWSNILKRCKPFIKGGQKPFLGEKK